MCILLQYNTNTGLAGVALEISHRDWNGTVFMINVGLGRISVRDQYVYTPNKNKQGVSRCSTASQYECKYIYTI